MSLRITDKGSAGSRPRPRENKVTQSPSDIGGWRLGGSFTALLLADSLILLALMVGQVAIPWWIAHAGGARDLAIYAAVSAAGLMIALPLLSPIGDRLDKRSLIIAGTAGMTLAAYSTAALARAANYELPLLLALALVGVVSNAVLLPASASIVAELLPAHQTARGLGLQKSAQSVGRLLGPAAAGAAIAFGDTALALLVQAVLFPVALACAFGVRKVPPPKEQAARSWRSEFSAGMRAKWLMPLERGWTIASFFVAILFLPGIGMLLPLKLAAMGSSGAWLGASEAASSVGMLAGSLGASIWLANRLGRFSASVASVVVMGACFACIGLASHPLLVAVTLVPFGVCVATAQLVGQTHRLLAIPSDFRSRMMAAHIMVMQMSGVIGPALAAAALAPLGVDMVYVVIGVALLILGFGYALIPGYRAFMRMSHEEVKGHYGRAHPELFGR